MKTIDKFSVFFSSNDSLVQTPDASFSILLDPHKIKTDSSNMMKIHVAQIIIRNTLQDVSIYCNSLIWNGNHILLPTGNPSMQDIITYLSPYGLTFTMGSNNRLVFSCTGVLSFSANSCAVLLGFEEGFSYSITPGYIPVERVMLADHSQILLKSSITSNNIELDNEGNTACSRTLCSIANVAKPNGLLVYQDIHNLFDVILRDINDLNQIHISLTDQEGRPLVIDGIWSVVLNVEILQETETDILASLDTLNNSISELLRLQRMKLISKTLPNHRKKGRHDGASLLRPSR